jgi:hypothetical protein
LCENAALFAPIIPRQGIVHSQAGNKIFPVWEKLISLEKRDYLRDQQKTAYPDGYAVLIINNV